MGSESCRGRRPRPVLMAAGRDEARAPRVCVPPTAETALKRAARTRRGPRGPGVCGSSPPSETRPFPASPRSPRAATSTEIKTLYNNRQSYSELMSSTGCVTAAGSRREREGRLGGGSGAVGVGLWGVGNVFSTFHVSSDLRTRAVNGCCFPNQKQSQAPWSRVRRETESHRDEC